MSRWEKGAIRHQGEVICLYWTWKDYMVSKDPYPHSYSLIRTGFGPHPEDVNRDKYKQRLHPDADLGKYPGLREATNAGEAHYQQRGGEIVTMQWSNLEPNKWRWGAYLIECVACGRYGLKWSDKPLGVYTRLSTAKRGALRDISRATRNDTVSPQAA
jgi:hypothetical protein